MWTFAGRVSGRETAMAENAPPGEGWNLFQDILKANVTPITWQTWLRPLRSGDSSQEAVTVLAPTDFHLRWLVEKYGDLLEEAVAASYGPAVALHLEADPESLRAADLDLDEAADSDPAMLLPAAINGNGPLPVSGCRLVGKYRFESFVVGPSNRFAHAASMAVAEQPGSHYNPLFIVGGAGLGKTHLLNAVGHAALELYPGCVVRYVSSENFFNEFIDGIRRKRMDEFKHRYRTTDVLLLDDVQFFEGKEQILEEFFHTFNSLYESGKQMVLSSDRAPRHLATLEDRLRSRFEWGLVTDIQPPDVETRLAILRKNLEHSPHAVPEDVLLFIAEHVPDNVRELEGALTRVTAYAVLTGERIDLEMARDVLQDLIPTAEARPLSPEDIISTSAASYGYTPADLIGPSRRQPLVTARQVAMYLCRELTNLSLPKVGALFGGRDHTTVLYAVEKVKRLIQTDRDIFERVTALSQLLRTT
ncbi:MAG: chromosomal replication initiator protein DnaA [Acidimicrobiia bacterium]